MTPVLTKGWLPVDLHTQDQARIVQEGAVRWVEFGETPLSHPFFAHTVSMLREADPPPGELLTDFAALLRLSSLLPTVQPAGFIFHISHCGSTLISNAMRTTEQVVVVSEPGAVTKLLVPRATPSKYLERRWDERRRAMLQAMFALFATYRTGEPERILVKFTSVNILALPVIRRYWPDVPCLIVIRDPTEVMVSSPPGYGWMAFKDLPYANDIFGWPESTPAAAKMTNEEFCARVLGDFLRTALHSIDGDCMLIDYEDLKRDRMEQIAHFFGLKLPAEKKKVDAVFSVYSKDPSRQNRFEHDRKRKQRQATALVRSAAHQWAQRPYADLRAR